MDDSRVTLDTGFAWIESFRAPISIISFPMNAIHGIGIMTITTLPGIGLSHPLPYFTRQFRLSSFEFLRCINGSRKVMI